MINIFICWSFLNDRRLLWGPRRMEQRPGCHRWLGGDIIYIYIYIFFNIRIFSRFPSTFQFDSGFLYSLDFALTTYCCFPYILSGFPLFLLGFTPGSHPPDRLGFDILFPLIFGINWQPSQSSKKLRCSSLAIGISHAFPFLESFGAWITFLGCLIMIYIIFFNELS